MALFTSMFQQDPRRPQPYNVPTQGIRPLGNQVNIQGGLGTNPADAFAAFSRLQRPGLESFADLSASGAVRPINAQGAPIAGPSQQYTPEDINSALMAMFQRSEDAGTLSRYQGFSPQTRRRY